MYVQKHTWLENGPRRSPKCSQGLGSIACPDGQQESPAGGVCVPVLHDSVNVNGCAPDICVKFPFPWVGRRTETAGDPAWADTNGCACAPVFNVPASIGKVVTVGVLGLVGLALIRGMRG